MQLRDNVTDISARVSPFPQESTLYFPVVERPDGWQDKHGNWHKDDSVKKLIRVTDRKAHVLATVGKGFNTMLNSVVFPYVEERMVLRLGPQVLRDVQVTERMSYNGRDCYREYLFPSVRCDVPGGGDVAFRLIIGNSYGGKPLQVISGGIIGWCTNGMILGVHEAVARKHTSGLSITGIDKWIGDSVTYFTKHGELMAQWAGTVIPHVREQSLFKALVSKSLISERGASQLNEGMHYERSQRNTRTVVPNPTLWHLYNALTAWASHGIVRDTGNDHVANTRIDRGKHVNRVMHAAEDYLRKAA